MRLGQVVTAARSPAGRLATGAVGLTIIALVVRGIGLPVVARTVVGAAALFPLVAALEMVQLACTMNALRSLYHPATAPLAQYVRAGLVGYAVMGLVPAGRTVAEVSRASMLSRWIGGPRAAAAAARIQGAALLANAAITVPAVAAAWLASREHGPWWLPLAVGANFVVCTALGLSVLIGAAKASPGAWLGRKLPTAQGFGASLDDLLKGEPLFPWGAIGWEFVGRSFQVVQCAVLLQCVAGEPTLRNALTSEGILLVGGAIGDLLPAQLGATEGNYSLTASALGLTAAASVSIALLAHLAQLLWVVLGTLVSVIWPAPPEAAEGPRSFPS